MLSPVDLPARLAHSRCCSTSYRYSSARWGHGATCGQLGGPYLQGALPPTAHPQKALGLLTNPLPNMTYVSWLCVSTNLELFLFLEQVLADNEIVGKMVVN